MAEQNMLEKVVSEKRRIEFDEKGAREIIEETLSQPLLPFEHEQVMTRAKRFVGYWFVGKLAEKYSLLSGELFDLKQTLEFEGNEIEIPSFFNVDISKENKEEVVLRVRSHSYNRNREFEIRATVPELSAEARDAYIDARSFSVGLVRMAYDDALMRRILVGAKDIPTPDASYYRMIWASEKVSITDITPVPKDPALVMTYWGVNYLIHKWDCPGERPIDPFLKEFSQNFPEGKIIKQ